MENIFLPLNARTKKQDSTQEKRTKDTCDKQWIPNLINAQNMQSRQENPSMNGSKFSSTKAKRCEPLNPCLCIVCDNILSSKLKTSLGEEKSEQAKAYKTSWGKLTSKSSQKSKPYHVRS